MINECVFRRDWTKMFHEFWIGICHFVLVNLSVNIFVSAPRIHVIILFKWIQYVSPFMVFVKKKVKL